MTHIKKTSNVQPKDITSSSFGVENQGAKDLNSIHPNYAAMGECSEVVSLSPDDMHNIAMGNFLADKVVAFGITHYKYKDCNPKNLVSLNKDIKIHKDCKVAFENMQKAALKDGVDIQIVSGFRSEKYQVQVFNKKFRKKGFPTSNEMEARLRFSAPSGYSEHHTGLAIDINSTEQSFADTKAYSWLQENAHKFGFENSFPENNKQGLGFEPWHWRFVGNEESEKVFEQVRQDV